MLVCESNCFLLGAWVTRFCSLVAGNPALAVFRTWLERSTERTASARARQSYFSLGSTRSQRWARARMLCVCGNGDDKTRLSCCWVCWQKQLRVLQISELSSNERNSNEEKKRAQIGQLKEQMEWVLKSWHRRGYPLSFIWLTESPWIWTSCGMFIFKDSERAVIRYTRV